MRKKELMVTDVSEDLALKKLRDQMDQYVASRNATTWDWIVKPATRQRNGEWLAYGRIEFSVGKKAGLG